MKSFLPSIPLFLAFYFCSLGQINAQLNLDWAYRIGGSSYDDPIITEFDAAENMYILGKYSNIVDFDPGIGVFQLNSLNNTLFLAKYDKDGNLIWAYTLDHDVNGMDVDAAGNIYLTGDFYGIIDIASGPTIYNLSSVGGSGDIYVAKYNTNFNLSWVKQFGGMDNEAGSIIHVNSFGQIYVIGSFAGSISFSQGLQVYILTSNLPNTTSSFILKLHNDGGFLWAKSFNVDSYDVRSFHSDSNGNIYLCGSFRNTFDADLGPGISNITASGQYDAYLIKMDGGGNFIWAKSIGGIYDDESITLSIDASGNVILVGRFEGTVDFDPGPATYTLTSYASSYYDIFILKLDMNGNFTWAKKIGATYDDHCNSISLDNAGNIYLIGSFYGPIIDMDPGPAVVSYSSPNYYRIFLLKLTAGGDYAWSKEIGGSSSDFGNGNKIFITPNSALYIVGAFSRIQDVDFSPAIMYLSSAGQRDLFFAKYQQKIITGYTYRDNNQDCIIGETENSLAGRRVLINPGNIVAITDQRGTWNASALPDGNYTITVDSSGGWTPSCSTTQSFVVNSLNTIAPSFGFYAPNPIPVPQISIQSSILRLSRPDDAYLNINVCNDYTASANLDSAYVIVYIDSLFQVQYADIPYTSLGNNEYSFYLGNIAPGECINFFIYGDLSPSTILGQTLCFEANLYPVDSRVLDRIPNPYSGGISPCNTPWDNSSLSVEGACLGDTVKFVIRNNGAPGIGDMSCFAPIRLFIDGQFVIMDSIQLAAGDSLLFNFLGDGRTWRLEVAQHPLHPGNSQPSATLERCGNHQNWTPGWYNVLPQNDADPIVDITCIEVRASYDPNDKTGFPYGRDSAHYILQNQDIEYVIRFQNTGTDTAFTVVIRDTLSEDFDIFSVRSGAASHGYSFNLYGPRVLEWTFNNIMLPDSNVNEPGSHGFVSFNVKQVKDLPIGTVLENRVGIYFDNNEPVITNTYFHTIDSLNPLNWNSIDTISMTLCDNEPINNLTYLHDGLYMQPIYNNNLPDSLLYLNLSVLNTSHTYIQNANCDSFIYNGLSYLATGNYEQVFTNSIGCDSIVHIEFVNQRTAMELNEISCNEYTLNNETFNNSGTYTQVLNNSMGCDSIITLHLQIENPAFIDTTITINSNNLRANQANADAYQWVDCDNGFAQLPGDTTNIIYLSSSANYAVDISVGNCTVRSACTYLKIGSGMVSVYPNPVVNSLTNFFELTVDFGDMTEKATVRLHAMDGRLLQSFEVENQDKHIIDFKDYAPGFYFVIVRIPGQKQLAFKVVRV